MSFFDDASLAFLPSGAAGKDGKAYSIKPTDGTGDFTFSRGSNLAATRVGADGLIEKGRENLLLQSNQFDTTWGTTGSAILTSGQSGYDGTNDAWLLTKSASSTFISQTTTLSAVNTFSVYAKAGTNTHLAIWIRNSNDGKYFDLVNGTIGSDYNSTPIDAKIESVGNGWYRCSVTTINADNNCRIYPADADGDVSGTSGSIYIQDAQLEIGLAATDYIESGATTGKAGLLEDEPRFDYSGGATCPSLLLEPSRTNLVQSEYLDGIAWSGKIGVSFDTNTTTSPEGLENSALLKEDSSNGSHFAYKDFSLTSGSTYTISIFAKSNGTNRNLRFGDGGLGWSSGFNGVFDLTAGTATGGTIEPMGSGWYRCSVTGTTNATSSRLIVYSTLGVATSYQGDGSSGVYLYGFQIEQGSYPTSYIPNNSGGSVTRGKDTTTTGDITSIVNSPEGTIFSEFAKINDFDAFQLDDGSLNNRITLYPRNNTSSITFIFTIGGVEVIRQNPSPSGLDTTEFNKYAIAWGLNDFRVYVNGVKIYTSTSNITFGSGAIDDLDLNGANHKQLLIFPEALSDADCITLTT